MILATGLYDWLLLGHIIAAMIWLGGGVMLAALATRTRRAANPEEVARFFATLRVLGPWVLAPATIAVIALGVWLVLDDSAWDFGQAWVHIAIGLVAAAVVVGAAGVARAALRGERASARGDHHEALRQLGRWSSSYRLIIALLIVATWDMTTKPGL